MLVIIAMLIVFNQCQCQCCSGVVVAVAVVVVAVAVVAVVAVVVVVVVVVLVVVVVAVVVVCKNGLLYYEDTGDIINSLTWKRLVVIIIILGVCWFKHNI